jgi:hypothetical protein
MQLAVLTLLLAMSAPLMAQQIKVNPKVGLNVSALDTKIQDIRAEARVGWNAGVDFRIGGGIFYLNPGVHYNNFTARLIKDVEFPDDIAFKDETTIQSVRLPLNLGLRLTGDNGLLGVHVKGGVTPAYVIGVSEKPEFSFDIDRLNRFTLGANVGAGVDVLIFTIDANYEIGLSDFFKDSDGRNNMLTLSVGLKF